MQVPVFFVTSIFMIIAYTWLVVIVALYTPDVVDIWEALVTLLLLPVLGDSALFKCLSDFGYTFELFVQFLSDPIGRAGGNNQQVDTIHHWMQVSV